MPHLNEPHHLLYVNCLPCLFILALFLCCGSISWNIWIWLILFCTVAFFFLACKPPQKTVQHMELQAAWCLKWEFHVCINSRFTICRKALFLMFTLTYFIIYLWLTFIEIWLQHLILLFKRKLFFLNYCIQNHKSHFIFSIKKSLLLACNFSIKTSKHTLNLH